MRANVVTAHGEAKKVFSIRDVPMPVMGENDLLLSVFATSVNPLDCKIRTASAASRVFPLILGFDVCGEIIDMGAGSQGFKIGDKVVGAPSTFRNGANAEFLAIDYRSCALLNDVNCNEGAALPLVGITAYEALFRRLKVGNGDTVFIHAGAGGVGHIAIQLAKSAGCKIVTTASQEESLRYCSNDLKADVVLNYKKENIPAAIMDMTNGQGVDRILDTVGGTCFSDSLKYVSTNGHICSILPVSLTPEQGYRNLLKNITLSYQFMGGIAGNAPDNNHGKLLSGMIGMVKRGELKPKISAVFDLENLSDAHEEVEKGHCIGKVIVKVSGC